MIVVPFGCAYHLTGAPADSTIAASEDKSAMMRFIVVA